MKFFSYFFLLHVTSTLSYFMKGTNDYKMIVHMLIHMLQCEFICWHGNIRM